MMVRLAGTGNGVRSVKDIWAGQYQCSNCGQISNFHLYQVQKCAYMFFIPFLSITMGWLLVCDTCHSYRELKKKEYNDIRKGQIAKLKSGEIPADIVLRDYGPKEI